MAAAILKTHRTTVAEHTRAPALKSSLFIAASIESCFLMWRGHSCPRK
jgi:hypothetical protein